MNDENTTRQATTDEDVSRPMLLTVIEVATLLRTSNKAVYVMAEREKLPGKLKLGSRLLFRRDDLYRHLGLVPDEKKRKP